jgi:hypothetical protein
MHATNNRGEVMLLVVIALAALAGMIGTIIGDEARRQETRHCLSRTVVSVPWEPTPEHWDRLVDWCTQP